MKQALTYVLLNFSKHFGREPIMDRYSSALSFPEWTKLIGWRFCGDMRKEWRLAREGSSENLSLLQESLSPPRSWLARQGWMKAA